MNCPGTRHELLERLKVRKDLKLLACMRQMNTTPLGVFLVVDGERLLGTLTAGDMRRWIAAREGRLDAAIEHMFNSAPVTVGPNFDRDRLRRVMLEKKLSVVPVVDDRGRLLDVVLLEDLFGGYTEKSDVLQDLDVVIVAGGPGGRMKPFTSVLPKALLPFRDKTVLEAIMDDFHLFGARRFRVILNYKKEMVTAYFKGAELVYEVDFVDEGQQLGTCGGLQKLDPATLSEDFFLSNCDTLLDADFGSVYEFHRRNENEVTLICTARDFVIPYGVVTLKGDGGFGDLMEKPCLNYLVNTGVYVLRKTALRELPQGRSMGTPDWIRAVADRGGRVGVYPLPAGTRLDTGQWEGYRHTVSVIDGGGREFLR